MIFLIERHDRVVAIVVASGAASAHLARCPEGFESPAYWPWRQLARALRSPVAADLERLAGRRPSPLAVVEPGPAGAGAPASPPEAPSESVRLQLFESAALDLACEARERPIVLVLEDVQRADLASLGFVRFLAHLLPVLPILIVATFREADLAQDPNPDAAVADGCGQGVPAHAAVVRRMRRERAYPFYASGVPREVELHEVEIRFHLPAPGGRRAQRRRRNAKTHGPVKAVR